MGRNEKRLDVDTIDALRSTLDELRGEDEAGDLRDVLEAIETAMAPLLDGVDNLTERLLDILHDRLPRFFYFGEYSTLPGRVDLRELAGREPPASSRLQTARALLELAGTDITRLGEEDYELRKAELEAVSNDLTRQVFEYWTQNEDLSVTIDVDKVTETTAGKSAVARYLDIRVLDQRHGYTNNFGQRSSGFQWFFSFLAAFSEFEGSDANLVILLDEPALGLPARAQRDFLRFINERLAPAGQVIYTTHSPFMVETGQLERVRVVQDTGPDEGAHVSTDVFATDHDTLFPLQAALGYDIAQNLFVAPEALLVEGTSEFTYLTLMSDHLDDHRRTSLDERFTVTPSGGVHNVPTFVALLGVHLDLTVLVDSGTKGVQRLTDMAAQGLLAKERLVMVGEVTGERNADIEDVFTPGDYLKIYNAATNSSLKVTGLPKGDRIVKRIAEKLGEDFDHGTPADHLLRNKADFVGKFSAGTLDRFEGLFERLNRTLDR